MYEVLCTGFTSGFLIGFIAEWLWKNSRFCKLNGEAEDKVPYVPTANEKSYRMALVVNKELKMGDGKVMAQCAHAAVGTYESYYNNRTSNFEAWERQGKLVSVFKVSDTETLEELYKVVKSRSMISCLVRDAGRTQIASGSKTVLAIGPEEEAIVNSATEYLLPYS